MEIHGNRRRFIPLSKSRWLSWLAPKKTEEPVRHISVEKPLADSNPQRIFTTKGLLKAITCHNPLWIFVVKRLLRDSNRDRPRVPLRTRCMTLRKLVHRKWSPAGVAFFRAERCGIFLLFFRRGIPSGEHTKSYGKSPFFMGKSTISMAIFNSYMLNYQRVSPKSFWNCQNFSGIMKIGRIWHIQPIMWWKMLDDHGISYQKDDVGSGKWCSQPSPNTACSN